MEAVLPADAVGWNRIFGPKRARSRIGRRAIETDDGVEEAARPDEGVQRFEVLLSRPELGTAARRCERSPEILMAGAADRIALTPEVMACSRSFRLASP